MRVAAILGGYWRAAVGSQFLPSERELELERQLGNVRSAREKLVAGVERAVQITPRPPARAERALYAAAIQAVTDYLREIGAPLETVLRFQELGMALNDLDDGIVWEMLRPDKAHNRPGDAYDLWQARATLSVAMDTLIAAGWSRNHACRYITKRSRVLPQLTGRNAKSPDTALMGWYAAFATDKVKNSSAQRTFDARRQISPRMAKFLGTDDPERMAAYYVEMADAMWLRENPPS